MLFVKHNNTNPYRSHAIEEFLMNKFNEDCFMLWKNDKCILLGRNQNAYNEINIDYVKENNIPIVRRITGGGAVFNDEGNFNFTFISCNKSEDFGDFFKFATPIISALRSIGVNAELSGRNDITIDGKKFSGNAQCKYKDKVLHHGTLLFSLNVTDLTNALRVKPIKLEGKGVKSVQSRVTNISEYLKTPMTTEEFKDFLFEEVYKNTIDARFYTITEDDWKEIDSIMEEKYMKWEWNFGKSPKFNIEKEMKFTGGIVQACLDVNKGKIKSAKLYGDFFNGKDIAILENALVGLNYSLEVLEEALKSINVGEYLRNITNENMLELLF